MAFLNERISDEDIKKYTLMDVWNRYKLDEKIKVLNSDKPYDFAIDRENNQWLIYLARVKHERWEPKRQGYTDEHIFLFYYNSVIYEIRLIRKKYEAKFAEVGHKVLLRTIAWDLKSIDPTPNDSNILKALKEALTVYGEDGLFTEDVEHLIECNF